ncbi:MULTISPECIES: MarR family winged helix-turn-helix transcriptional regulator [Nocardiopsis]|uniref:Transcriptional regulator, MarR family n=1 Tax=Nocardiopsis dassonvillei (strain ATCC 23218 / DSM 43111 / CIP 107115 / JCM 7437 / KCTC 9190 / NBRC 14626 / NCTC 10488 / NRRL B-5397 / IMRU 509) TaxID=446468 RepID=D7B1P7_NOCDD|nr:transcriptional regulator, MarR family [Nocardiopsis dassonvillei subsp. dassonvillei DSM 43111]VEI88979.1 transcriptional repressor MprA [Nocardiopsis dassonvillei]
MTTEPMEATGGASGAGDAGGATSDDDLITAWGLVHEAMNVVQPKLLGGITPDGKDMAGPWFEVLIRLQRTPGHRLPMSRLAREVSLSTGGFTKLADRLEREGYLERENCASDRRVVYAVLTDSGLDFIGQARTRHVERLREHVLGPLGEDGVRRLAAIARTLRDSSCC